MTDFLPENISHQSFNLPNGKNIYAVIKIKNFIITGGRDENLYVFDETNASSSPSITSLI